MDDPAAREIEGYRIEAEIGRGARAVVHRATQLARQRTVALKLLPAEAAERTRIVRGAAAATGADHPHVLPVYEVGETAGAAFIAMKLVDGPSLEELIRASGGIEVRRGLAILRQVADALDHIAAGGGAHGDVRTGSVLIGPGDHAYLAGAGLGSAAPAPERAPADPPTAAADRYALAAMAMEVLTGAPVFARADRTAAHEAHRRKAPPAASERNPSLGPAVDAVLARGLAKDPAARRPTAAAFVAELEAAVLATPGAAASRPLAAPRPAAAPPPPPPPPLPPAPVPPPSPAPGPATAPAPVPGDGTARWRVPAIVLGVLAALAVVIGVVAAATGGGGEARTVTELVLATTATPAPTTGPVAPAVPSSGFPLGAVLPAAVDGWRLTATDPGLINLELGREGDVETARAARGGEVGLLAGLHPDGEDGRIAVERLRVELGGTQEGPVPLGPGIVTEGILQSQGGVAAVSFGAPDRAIIAIAPTREGAIALAAAANEALGP